MVPGRIAEVAEVKSHDSVRPLADGDSVLTAICRPARLGCRA